MSHNVVQYLINASWWRLHVTIILSSTQWVSCRCLLYTCTAVIVDFRFEFQQSCKVIVCARFQGSYETLPLATHGFYVRRMCIFCNARIVDFAKLNVYCKSSEYFLRWFTLIKEFVFSLFTAEYVSVWNTRRLQLVVAVTWFGWKR